MQFSDDKNKKFVCNMSKSAESGKSTKICPDKLLVACLYHDSKNKLNKQNLKLLGSFN